MSNLYQRLEYSQFDVSYKGREYNMTKEQVMQAARNELARRENIEVSPDADEYDIVYEFNTYFGAEEAYNLRNDIIRAERHAGVAA